MRLGRLAHRSNTIMPGLLSRLGRCPSVGPAARLLGLVRGRIGHESFEVGPHTPGVITQSVFDKGRRARREVAESVVPGVERPSLGYDMPADVDGKIVMRCQHSVDSLVLLAVIRRNGSTSADLVNQVPPSLHLWGGQEVVHSQVRVLSSIPTIEHGVCKGEPDSDRGDDQGEERGVTVNPVPKHSGLRLCAWTVTDPAERYRSQSRRDLSLVSTARPVPIRPAVVARLTADPAATLLECPRTGRLLSRLLSPTTGRPLNTRRRNDLHCSKIAPMSSDSGYSVVGRFDPADSNDPDGDHATLAALAAHGNDLSLATHFIHFLAFSDEQKARAAGKALAEQLGYRVRGFGPGVDALGWSVHAETDCVPTIENVRRMRQVMETAAERYGGEYEGWEAAVQRAPDHAMDP